VVRRDVYFQILLGTKSGGPPLQRGPLSEEMPWKEIRKKDDEADPFERLSPHWFLTNRHHPAGCHNGIDPPRPCRHGLDDREGRPLSPLFILNCVGYLVLVTAHYLPTLQRFQRLTRWLLIAYTAVTVLLWYVIASSHADLVDYVDKLVEVVLIILLLVYWLRLSGLVWPKPDATSS
jgi:hypothetical protein